MIGKGVVIENSVVGPHVTLSAGCKVSNSILKNSIIYENTVIESEVIANSMIGEDVQYFEASEKLKSNRIDLLETCKKIVFNSEWSKRQFLKNSSGIGKFYLPLRNLLE